MNFSARTFILICSLFLLAGTAAGQDCRVTETASELKADCAAEEVSNSDAEVYSTISVVVDAGKDGSAIAFKLGTATEPGHNLPSPENVLAEIGADTYRLNIMSGEREFKKGYKIEWKYVVVSKETAMRIAEANHFRIQIGETVYNLEPATDQMFDVAKKIAAKGDSDI